jgi:hypothetical protein
MDRKLLYVAIGAFPTLGRRFTDLVCRLADRAKINGRKCSTRSGAHERIDPDL